MPRASIFWTNRTGKLKLSAAVGCQSEQGARSLPSTVLSDSARPDASGSRNLAVRLRSRPSRNPPRVQKTEGIIVSQVVVLWAKDRIMGTLFMGSRRAREFSTAELNLLAAVGNQIATTIDKSLLLEETRDGL